MMTSARLPGKDQALKQKWADDRLAHNLRVGMQLDAELSRVVGLNLEVTANNMARPFQLQVERPW